VLWSAKIALSFKALSFWKTAMTGVEFLPKIISRERALLKLAVSVVVENSLSYHAKTREAGEKVTSTVGLLPKTISVKFSRISSLA
jgi:hypothetical protein